MLDSSQRRSAKRPFRRLRKIECLRGFSLSANDFADAKPSEVVTAHVFLADGAGVVVVKDATGVA